jgi:hypothetical protein
MKRRRLQQDLRWGRAPRASLVCAVVKGLVRARRVARVEVSADGGASWAKTALQRQILPQSFTRVRLPWEWDGAVATLLSRATDERTNAQPTRAT